MKFEPQRENEDKCPFESHGCIVMTCLPFIGHFTIPFDMDHYNYEDTHLCTTVKLII